MGRLLQLLLLAALIWVVWRLVRNALAPPPAGGAGDAPKFEPTARCAQCGTHVPRAQLDAGGLCPRCQSARPAA
jgi:uncharacterized protein